MGTNIKGFGIVDAMMLFVMLYHTQLMQQFLVDVDGNSHHEWLGQNTKMSSDTRVMQGVTFSKEYSVVWVGEDIQREVWWSYRVFRIVGID